MTRAELPHGFRLRIKASCALAVLLAAAAPSCDIKEDRGPCPCLLTLIYKDIPEAAQNVFRARIYRGDYLLSDEDVDTISEPDEHTVRVSKGENQVCYFGGVRKERLEGDRLLIPEGEESDPLFIGSEPVMCKAERTSVLLDFRKEYCLLTLELEGLVDGIYPYDIKISGNTAGIDLRSLAPVEGRFWCIPSMTAGQVRSARIPRQKDRGLTLTLEDRTNGRTHSLPLGEMISRSGYSWDKKNLDDITVRIDFASGDVTVIASDWETGAVKDIIL